MLKTKYDVLTRNGKEKFVVIPMTDYEALLARMEQHGLTEAQYYPLTFGIATLYVGVKTSSPT